MYTLILPMCYNSEVVGQEAETPTMADLDP